MSYLIDTQILIWFQKSNCKLKSENYSILVDTDNIIYVSQVSLFEIAIKQKIGKLPELDLLIGDFIRIIQNDGFKILPIKNQHIDAYNTVPLVVDHRDPFDRLILATALSENLPIIYADENFKLYIPQIQLIEN